MKIDRKVAFITDDIYLKHDTGTHASRIATKTNAPLMTAIIPLKHRLSF